MFALRWFEAFWGLRRVGLARLGVFVGLLLPWGLLRLVLRRWGLLALLLRWGLRRLVLVRLLLRQLALRGLRLSAFWGLRRLGLVRLGVLAGQLLRLGLLRLVMRRLDLLWPHCLAPWKLA